MRTRTRSSVVAAIAAVGMVALAAAPLPPQGQTPPTVVREVGLTAAPAPALGEIPLAFIRNQFQYCSLICPYAVQGAIAVPVAAAQAPATFLGTLATTGSVLRAIGTAAASVTGPANAAVTPLIDNDVFLVVPKAFHALDVAIVEAINVALSPGDFLNAVQTGRTRILDALNQPVGQPTTPTGARNILQVLAVSAVDITTAVAFQAGELLLAGVVQVADAAAQELARSGDPAAALTAGVTRAGQVLNTATAPVVSAVNSAVTNIRDSLHDPFPAPMTTAPPVHAPTVTSDGSKTTAVTVTKRSPRTTIKSVSERESSTTDSEPTASTSSSSSSKDGTDHPAKPGHKVHHPGDRRDAKGP